MSSTQLYTGDPKRLATARGSAPPSPAARAHQPPAQRWPTAVSGSQAGIGQACVCQQGCARGAAHRGSRRRPRGALECARRAIQRRRPARQRPTAPRRCGSCAAAHGHDDDGRLPGGRLTRALPPRANGHDRGAWCERRNRAASARWAPRSPGQPASRLHPRALVRAAFDNIGSDRRGLRARHADTHAHSNTRGARRLKVRRSPSIGRARQITCSDHLARRSPRRDHLKVSILL